MTDHEWQIGDEVEYVDHDGSLSGHFGVIYALEENVSVYKLRVAVRDYTNKSRGLDGRFDNDHKQFVLWYAEAKPTDFEFQEFGGIRLRKPTAPAETRIGLVREELDWSLHEELKRLALGNQK